MNIEKICVYCASSNKIAPVYGEVAYKLGKLLAEENITLITGAGSLGLMCKVQDGTLDNGGKAIGVIPQFMVDQGWNNPESTETIVTQTMHERKAKIVEISDAMVALPGGIGTFEELLECLTWKQLGLHHNPVVILNTEGYYDKLLECIDLMVDEQMMRPIHKEMFVVVSRPEEVLPAIMNAPEWDPSTRRLAAI